MLLLDGTGRRLVGDIHNIIHMLAHRDEQIEKPEWQGSSARCSFHEIKAEKYVTHNLLPPISISICMVPLLLKILRLLIIKAR